MKISDAHLQIVSNQCITFQKNPSSHLINHAWTNPQTGVRQTDGETNVNVIFFPNGSFYELANPLCLWNSGTEIMWFMGNGYFSVSIGQKCCVLTCIHVPPFHECSYARYVYMNHDVEFLKKCLKLCSMKFWSCLESI